MVNANLAFYHGFACFINRPKLYFIAGLFANKGNGLVIDAGVCGVFDFQNGCIKWSS